MPKCRARAVTLMAANEACVHCILVGTT
jgi:hypothetical protein